MNERIIEALNKSLKKGNINKCSTYSELKRKEYNILIEEFTESEIDYLESYEINYAFKEWLDVLKDVKIYQPEIYYDDGTNVEWIFPSCMPSSACVFDSEEECLEFMLENGFDEDDVVIHEYNGYDIENYIVIGSDGCEKWY